jgi:hydroxymethylpyrimidine kinase/phosphomethylpyrimidine kinase
MTEARKVLTIAGSDSGGGAGIQADIKTITLLGAYASCVITAVTAQNTLGVQDIHAVPADFVALELESVLSDIRPQTIKTGMLCNAEIVHVVAERLRQYSREVPLTLIVDPVMYAKSGSALLEQKAQVTIVKEIFPLATLVTPNIAETREITGIDVHSVGTMHEAAEKIFEMGPRNVLIKGGHLAIDAIDVLYDGKQFSEFFAPRIQTPHTHGTGCTFSSAIAAFMAMGDDLPTAIAAAKEFISAAIETAFPIGAGIGPVNPYGALLSADGDAVQAPN